MNARAAALFTASIALIWGCARADTVAHPVTATPPLQAVPAVPVSRNVQDRMRNCNAVADTRKLHAAARESFIKNCMASMAPHRSRLASGAGSQPKPHP